MAADGGFDGLVDAPDAVQAEDAGREFIESVGRLAGRDPARAKELIERVVNKVATIASYADIMAGSGVAAAPVVPVAGGGRTPETPGADTDLDELGRNQRSRIREVVILDILQANAGPCALAKLMAGLAQRRIVDSQAAVVSHLHRLKASGLITQPGQGFYDITSDGLGHLRKLKVSLGPLVGAGG